VETRRELAAAGWRSWMAHTHLFLLRARTAHSCCLEGLAEIRSIFGSSLAIVVLTCFRCFEGAIQALWLASPAESSYTCA